MIEVDRENFQEEVLEAAGPVLVDFWSPRCEHCLELDPEIEMLAEKYGHRVKFTKVNVLENRRLAISQKVLGLPVVAIYLGGQKVAELAGDVTGQAIEDQINQVAP
ncbi:MAG: thioredoxin family protein [Bacillota bacterium]